MNGNLQRRKIKYRLVDGLGETGKRVRRETYPLPWMEVGQSIEILGFKGDVADEHDLDKYQLHRRTLMNTLLTKAKKRGWEMEVVRDDKNPRLKEAQNVYLRRIK